MANVKPLVLGSGELRQLQSGDTLVDPSGAAYDSGTAHLGVIGTLFFNGSSGSASQVVATGVMNTGVTFLDEGRYAVTFNVTQADSKYRILGSAEDAAGDGFGYYVGVIASTKTTGGFHFQTLQDWRSPALCDGITLLVFRPT